MKQVSEITPFKVLNRIHYLSEYLKASVDLLRNKQDYLILRNFENGRMNCLYLIQKMLQIKTALILSKNGDPKARKSHHTTLLKDWMIIILMASTAELFSIFTHEMGVR